MGEKELTRRMVDGLDVHQVNPMNANYNDLRPTITINILAFELLPQDEPHAMYSIYNPKTHDRLNNDMELHFLELPKFVKGVQKPIREMTKMERLAMSEAAINKAYDATGIFLQDKAERLKYINREMALMDYRSGMMSAEERGEKRGEKRGEERGEKRADERYSRLIQILMSQKRMDDIGRIAADAAYRKKLYQEFHL
ncbi:Rpn family recombination-promoting nuclease/putative transposase [uncultured Selenomonas sp.]|uniref:Rpn family recombination-promoting nuclease/putative transposase n=1 Tax=uncultured Selenomonas sp. TaxID=159275 RepID=UPI0025E9E347|nr:Rpn family recombination-promoting nuclease/putative transposase [uncultured Selenomonas sp.]